MWNQSDRKPGVPVYDKQKERIPGQRHDLNKCTPQGTDVAGALLVAARDNPERLSSEAAFARLCGVAPLPASSCKTNRHRLNRGGDRIANNALWRIVMVRMRTDPRTRNYVERRINEGLSKKEIIRCLKRYVAREVYHRLEGLDER